MNITYNVGYKLSFGLPGHDEVQFTYTQQCLSFVAPATSEIADMDGQVI